MAKSEEAADGGATKYRVLRKLTPAEAAAPALVAVEGGATVEVETFGLLQDEFTGNAARKAAEKYGVGSYVAVPVRSFKVKTAEIPEPKLRIR